MTEALFRNGLRFSGVVKNPTTDCPMKHLSNIEVDRRGEHATCVSEESGTKPNLLVVIWTDREPRFFFCSAGTYNDAAPVVRDIMRIITDRHAKPKFQSPYRRFLKTYYTVCYLIDRHNRSRQQDLNLEKQIQDEKVVYNASQFSSCYIHSLFMGSVQRLHGHCRTNVFSFILWSSCRCIDRELRGNFLCSSRKE